MYEEIKNLNKQFSFEPEIKNIENFKRSSSLFVVGMGGSALAPLLLKTWSHLDITISHDYGLGDNSIEIFTNKLVVLSSYSGNTEEVIDAFFKAKEASLSMAVISTGGKLLSLAKENNVPYIEMPDMNVQPRLALGLSVKCFLKLLGEEEELKKISNLSKELDPSSYEREGKDLAQKIKGFVPIIYASNHNLSLAYNWKIKLNETGKIPAFYNILPELNHNEMTGFDVQESTKELSEKFYFIFLKDPEDNERVQKRMSVLEKLYKDRGLKIEIVDVTGNNLWYKIFSNLTLADWTAYHTALLYGVEAEQVPMVEEFKKLIV